MDHKTKKLKAFKPGSEISIGQFKFTVLEQQKNSTVVLANKIVAKGKFGYTSNYVDSEVRKYCNTKFYAELAKLIGDSNILTHTVNLMCEDGSNKNDSCKDEVSVITTENYRKYREYIPWIKEPYWTATKMSSGLSFNQYDCYIDDGAIGHAYYIDDAKGILPYCVLNSSINIDTDAIFLRTVKPGETVYIGDFKFIVLEHSFNNVLVIAANPVAKMCFGEVSDYKTSEIRKFCNNEFYHELAEIIGSDKIVTHKVDLTSEDGTGFSKHSPEENVAADKISLLTTEMYRKYRKFISPITQPWFTATSKTSITNGEGNIDDVCVINSEGFVTYEPCFDGFGVRPVCLLSSSTLVYKDDNLENE